MSYQQICKTLSDDILKIIFEYDGRWRKKNGCWISVIHAFDKRYILLHNMIIRQKNHKYSEYNTVDIWYNPNIHEHIPYKDHISYIFPIASQKTSEKYIHISKTINYNIHEETDKVVYKSMFNMVRAFMSHDSNPKFEFSSQDCYSTDAGEDNFMFGEVFESDNTVVGKTWICELEPYYEDFMVHLAERKKMSTDSE
jgi:hypothetical protein